MVHIGCSTKGKTIPEDKPFRGTDTINAIETRSNSDAACGVVAPIESRLLLMPIVRATLRTATFLGELGGLRL